MTRARWGIGTALLLVGLLFGLVAVSASTAEDFHIDWYAVASGSSAQSDGIMLHATAGQPAAGALSGGEFRVGAGYWGDTSPPDAPPPWSEIFLPLILKR
jgi:hypothetical protein